MKKTIICIIVCCFAVPAAAIDYNDFPPNLQPILDERITKLTEKGGICIAGSVITDDGAYFGSGKDVKVNFAQCVNTSLDIYDGGWFVMRRNLSANCSHTPGKLILRAFGYDSIDASMPILKDKITYLEYVMTKTPEEKLSTITGIVVNDLNEPLGDIKVNLAFPLPYREQPELSTTTEADGWYSFKDLTPTEYYIYFAPPPGYAGVSKYVKTEAGEAATQDIKIFPNLSIVIDYVYQADGNRSFTGGELHTGTIEWANGDHKGADFSEGKAVTYNSKSPRDIEITQEQRELKFFVTYVTGENGFYDAGDADFESVTEAGENDYSTRAKPCIIGHTYVVRTFEGNYAKFIVKNIFSSF